MSRIAVLGAGIVGRAAAWDLARRGHSVLVADANTDSAERVGREFDLEPVALDVSNGESLITLLTPMDAVVSAVPYGLGATVAATAIASGTHYCDFGGNPTVVGIQIEMDADARREGVAVVADCGLAPGLANVLALADIDALGSTTIDRVIMRVGALPADPTGTLEYQLAFSPGGLINEYDEPCEVIIDGRRVSVDPLTGFEDVEFPGIGTLEAFHTAGGSSSLPRLLDGRVRDLDYKTLRYPGHGRIFAAMREIGLFSEEVDPATGVAPRAVLVERLANRLPSGGADVVLLLTEATSGAHRHSHLLVDRHDGTFSALARTTAFPATALAHRMVSGEVAAGVRTMDQAIGGPALVAELRDVGIEITVTVDEA